MVSQAPPHDRTADTVTRTPGLLIIANATPLRYLLLNRAASSSEWQKLHQLFPVGGRAAFGPPDEFFNRLANG